MKNLEFSIDLPPIPQQRPRFSSKKDDTTATYNPQHNEKQQYKLIIKSLTKLNHLFCGPISVKIKFYLQLPKSLVSRKNKIDQHTQVPDIDNLLKFILDAMSGVIYADDSLVYKVECSKHFSDFARTHVIIQQDIPQDLFQGEINAKT